MKCDVKWQIKRCDLGFFIEHIMPPRSTLVSLHVTPSSKGQSESAAAAGLKGSDRKAVNMRLRHKAVWSTRHGCCSSGGKRGTQSKK